MSNGIQFEGLLIDQMGVISVVKGEELAHHHPPLSFVKRANIKDVTCPNTL